MTRRRFVALGLVRASPWGPTSRVNAQTGYVNGVFAATPNGPIELIAHADRVSNGQLRLSYGTFEDIPALAAVPRLLCNLPNWKPVLTWLSTRRIFKSEFAERRQLPFAVRPIKVTAVELRVADMEDAPRLQRLLAAVGAGPDNPAFLFVTMSNGTVARDYMVEIVRP